MTTLIILCALVGATVGLRFHVYVLVPMTAAAIVGVAVFAMAQGDHLWAIVFTALLSAAGGQVGYLCGSGARFIQRRSLHPDRRAISRSAPAPTQTAA